MDHETGHLLVVDDSEMNREMLSRRLERRGHRVDVAVDGTHALGLIDAHDYDVVILDTRLPDLSGLDILKTLRQTRSLTDLPIIMATAKDLSEDMVEAFKLGASDYVIKPLDFPVVLARVQIQLRLKRLARQKDDLLRTASHELRDPLANIAEAAALLAELNPTGAVVSPETHEIIAQLSQAVQRVRQTVDGMVGAPETVPALEP